MIEERRELLDCTAQLHQRIAELERALRLYRKAHSWRALSEASKNADLVLGKKKRRMKP